MNRVAARLGPFTITGAIVALLGIVCYVAGWQLGWIELMVVAAGCLAALLIAVAFVVGRLAIDIERSVDPGRVMVGEPAGALLTARNPGRRPTRSIVVDEHIGASIIPVTVPGLAPNADHRTFYQLPTERRARVRVGPAEVVRADPLRLLRRRVGHAPATDLWVHPRWALVEALPSGFAKDLEGPTSDASPAGDIAFHALRPYQLGDDRRHIHWMSTARSGTLMVRHYVDNRRPTLAVLLDDADAPYDDASFELAVEVVTSLVMSCMALQLPISARSTTEWLMGRPRPQGRDSMLETLTLVERSRDASSLVLAGAELARIESATSAIAVVTGRRPAGDLLPMVTHLRSRARVIVIVVGGDRDDSGAPSDPPVRALPGATVLNVSTLDEFRAGWNGIRGMNRWPLPWRSWGALTVVIGLAAASTLGLHSITDDWSFVGPAVLGALMAGAAFVIAVRFSLLPGETLAVALGLFVVGGVVTVSVLAAGDIPSLSSISDFFDGLVSTWADLLSAVSPADLTPRLSVAPYAIAWLGAVIGCSLLRWSPLPGLPVVGPLAGLALTVLLTDEDRRLSILVGAAIAVGALLLGFLLDPRRAATARADAFGTDAFMADASMLGQTESLETTTSTAPHARAVRAVLVIGAVALLAPLVGPHLPGASANERYDLRDQVVPPWDPLALPSPLVQVKAQLAAAVEDEVVFEVESDEPLTRWTSAVMTSYDGVVWTVADPNDPSSDFRPVSSRLPSPDVQPDSDPTVDATVTVRSLEGPWLPVPGAPTNVEFADGSATASGAVPAIVENQESSTVAVPTGVAPDMTYSVTALAPPTPTDDELRDHPLEVESAGVDLDVLPPQIRNLAADVTEGIDHGWGQVAAIRDLFRSEGFYDKSTRVPPGHSYYRLAEFLADPEQIVGYEEQYAAAAALIARIAELPVRVAVGFEVEPERFVDGRAEVRSGDASAWIEVRVDDVGWVPVSVSPPRSREPDAENAVAAEDQVATPNPPPPPQVPPDVDVFTENEEAEEPVEEEEEGEDEPDETAGGGGIGTLGWVAVGTGSMLFLVLAACGAIVVWKRRRTRRRRAAADPAARIAGAWLELTDRYEEAGVGTPDRATPLEAVRSMVEVDDAAAATSAQLVGLAREVDRAAYDRISPPPEAADVAWRYSDEAVDALLANQSLPRRTRMRVDPRTLRRRDPLAGVATLDPQSAPTDDEP